MEIRQGILHAFCTHAGRNISGALNVRAIVSPHATGRYRPTPVVDLLVRAVQRGYIEPVGV